MFVWKDFKKYLRNLEDIKPLTLLQIAIPLVYKSIALSIKY